MMKYVPTHCVSSIPLHGLYVNEAPIHLEHAKIHANADWLERNAAYEIMNLL